MPSNLAEFDIINKFLKPLTNSKKVSQNLSDDVAYFAIKQNEQIVISKDLIVEDVHFLASDGAFKIAAKLLLSNLSDLASSGAKPVYYMLGFSKNNQTDENFITDFCNSLKKIQNQYKISLIGGDTVKSDKLFFSVTIFGIAEKNKILSRLNGKNNDVIFVTQTIGDAYLGLNCNKIAAFKKLTSQQQDFLRNRHYFPTPRIKFAQELLKNNLSKCACDISDGLLADLKNICTASKLSAEIYLDKIPLSPATKNLLKIDKSIEIVDLAAGGEDYELIFTANKKDEIKILNLAKKLKIKVTNIGKLKKTNLNSGKIKVFNKNCEEIKIKKYGYEH